MAGCESIGCKQYCGNVRRKPTSDCRNSDYVPNRNSHRLGSVTLWLLFEIFGGEENCLDLDQHSSFINQKSNSSSKQRQKYQAVSQRVLSAEDNIVTQGDKKEQKTFLA